MLYVDGFYYREACYRSKEADVSKKTLKKWYCIKKGCPAGAQSNENTIGMLCDVNEYGNHIHVIDTKNIKKLEKFRKLKDLAKITSLSPQNIIQTVASEQDNDELISRYTTNRQIIMRARKQAPKPKEIFSNKAGGVSKSNRGGPKLCVDGFFYRIYSRAKIRGKSNTFLYSWRCVKSKMGCKAKAKTMGNTIGQLYDVEAKGEHIHPIHMDTKPYL